MYGQIIYVQRGLRGLTVEVSFYLFFSYCFLWGRFVRFVSTPAILERFVSIEREILQIGSSVEANELTQTHNKGILIKSSKCM